MKFFVPINKWKIPELVGRKFPLSNEKIRLQIQPLI